MHTHTYTHAPIHIHSNPHPTRIRTHVLISLALRQDDAAAPDAVKVIKVMVSKYGIIFYDRVRVCLAG